MTEEPLIRNSLVKALFEDSNDSVLIVDNSLKVISANPVALLQFEDILHQKLSTIFKSDSC